MQQVFNIMVFYFLMLSELSASTYDDGGVTAVFFMIILLVCWICYKILSSPLKNEVKEEMKAEDIKKSIEAEQKKLEDEILLEMAKGITKKALKTINPMNLIKAKDKFIQGFEDYLGYNTVYSIDDIMAFKHLIEKIKEKCATNGLDPYSIEPQDIVKCVYIIMSRAEIIAKKNQRIFADFNFKEVFATQSSSYDIRGNYDDIATHKKFTYVYAKNELDDIINDEIRKFIEKFSNKN
ncbi:MAG: hypothetical protein MR769_08020 [Campylobacter sp.]|uniref:hypothetical protein n=1 Tax=Campylobacter sp. TaxID=205 RepID=UPI002AA6B6C0|nr:hypothetical protein [Campylobacter sp.]MCI6344610.1 hypothetical protein [Campylobacter sp.]